MTDNRITQRFQPSYRTVQIMELFILGGVLNIAAMAYSAYIEIVEK